MDNDDKLKEIFGDKSLIDPETGVVDRDSPEFIELLKITPRPVFDELHRLARLWKEQREREIRRSKELAESRTEITLRDNRIQELEAQAAALRDALMIAQASIDGGGYDYNCAERALSANAGAALLKRLQAAEAVCEAFYSDYFEAINTVEDEEDFPDWCVAYRKWRELKTGECAIHMEIARQRGSEWHCMCKRRDNDCKKPPGALS